VLNGGEIRRPYPWLPNVVDISLLRIGNLVVACVPGEFTTMAGRRLAAAVREAVAGAWGDDVTVVIAGLTNTYASYVTTYEEYQVRGRPGCREGVGGGGYGCERVTPHAMHSQRPPRRLRRGALLAPSTGARPHGRAAAP
jgi:hypothetical protein